LGENSPNLVTLVPCTRNSSKILDEKNAKSFKEKNE
jgi:hypothetical protein